MILKGHKSFKIYKNNSIVLSVTNIHSKTTIRLFGIWINIDMLIHETEIWVPKWKDWHLKQDANLNQWEKMNNVNDKAKKFGLPQLTKW